MAAYSLSVGLSLGFLHCCSALGSFSFFHSVLLARHEEAISPVEIAFVDAALAHELRSLNLIVSAFLDDGRGNAVGVGLSILLEIKRHLIIEILRAASIYCIMSVMSSIIVLHVLQVNFNMDGLAWAIVLAFLLLRRRSLLLGRVQTRLAAALLLATRRDDVA